MGDVVVGVDGDNPGIFLAASVSSEVIFRGAMGDLTKGRSSPVRVRSSTYPVTLDEGGVLAGAPAPP